MTLLINLSTSFVLVGGSMFWMVSTVFVSIAKPSCETMCPKRTPDLSANAHLARLSFSFVFQHLYKHRHK